jgi:hypothetical protein
MYLAFWVINSFYIGGGSFDPGGISYVKYILEHGNMILGDPKWGYFEFPVNSIFGAILSQITNLPIFFMSKIFLVVATLLLTLSAYTFLLRLLNDSWKSFLGVVMAVLGSISVTVHLQFYRPGTMGFLYIAPILVLLGFCKYKSKITSAEYFLVILILGTTCMTHFISSVAYFFIFFGMYFYQRLSKKEPISLSFCVIILIAIIYLAWGLYVSLYTTNFILARTTAFLSGEFSLVFALRKGQLLLAEGIPFWATVVRVFWLITIYFIPVLITFKLCANSLFFKRESALEESLAAILGLLLLTGIMSLLDMGANRSIMQFLIFSTFFTPPLLINFLSNNQGKYFNRIVKRILKFLPILIIFLSFPTFLAHNPTVNTQIFYEKEHFTFRFIFLYHVRGDSFDLFSDADTLLLTLYYLPEANYNPIPYAPDYVKNETEFIKKLPQYIEVFKSSKDKSLFIYSPRIFHRPYIMLGIHEDHPIWQVMFQNLSYRSKIYDNGFNWIIM